MDIADIPSNFLFYSLMKDTVYLPYKLSASKKHGTPIFAEKAF